MKAPQIAQVRVAALEELAAVQAALRLWVASLSDDDEPLDSGAASPLQVSIRAIAEYLKKTQDTGPEPDSLNLMFAVGLVDMLEGALWRQCSGFLPAGSVAVDDLRQTAELTLQYLSQACSAVKVAQRAEGGAS